MARSVAVSVAVKAETESVAPASRTRKQSAAAAGTVVAHTARPGLRTRLGLVFFGTMAQRRTDRHPDLGIRLMQAREPLMPSAYLARAYLDVVIAAVVGTLPVAVYLATVAPPDARAAALLAVLPVAMALLAYSVQMLKPAMTARTRARDLENHLPYALNFMAALSSAGVVPNEVFRLLGKQEVYGEVAREAAWIHRDTSVFARDLVRALQAAARRSPSQQWGELLQGSVNTITSGGDLTAFFLAKSEQFTVENRRRLKAFLESMGVMAESYVVVAAASPLFLIVILAVMSLLSSGTDPTFLLYMLVLVAMPVIHGVFAFLLRTMRAD